MAQIEFYKENRKSPVLEWYKKVNQLIQVEFTAMIELLAEQGHKLQRPHSAPLRDKINELRIITSRGQFRILYFYHNKEAIIMTHAIAKKDKSCSK